MLSATGAASSAASESRREIEMKTFSMVVAITLCAAAASPVLAGPDLFRDSGTASCNPAVVSTYLSFGVK